MMAKYTTLRSFVQSADPYIHVRHINVCILSESAVAVNYINEWQVRRTENIAGQRTITFRRTVRPQYCS